MQTFKSKLEASLPRRTGLAKEKTNSLPSWIFLFSLYTLVVSRKLMPFVFQKHRIISIYSWNSFIISCDKNVKRGVVIRMKSTYDQIFYKYLFSYIILNLYKYQHFYKVLYFFNFKTIFLYIFFDLCIKNLTKKCTQFSAFNRYFVIIQTLYTKLLTCVITLFISIFINFSCLRACIIP